MDRTLSLANPTIQSVMIEISNGKQRRPHSCSCLLGLSPGRKSFLVTNRSLAISIKSNQPIKMEVASKLRLASMCLLLVWLQSRPSALCNPLAFNPAAFPMIAIPQMHPMMMGPQMDPYASMQHQYFMAPPFGMSPYDANRRSLNGFGVAPRAQEKSSSNKNNDDNQSDEQKALGDIPLSFIEPDPPSSITERLSESFSAIGEGVKNHFRSISENFSDTVDDIKDAWRSPNSQETQRG